jgi:metal-responsive CopG/Arc/MetJ family transcriptional regulator
MKERITISIDAVLIERVQVEADNQKRSLSNMIAYILESWLDQRKSKKEEKL